jgi:hypothetical protein
MSSKDTYAAINGQRCTSVVLTVGNVGPWHADCDLESDPDLSGRVELAIGTLKLSGTIDARTSDSFGLQRRVRVLADANG